MTETKIEAFWRDATAGDVAEIIKTGKPVLARFRDEDAEDWQDCLLAGWRISRYYPGVIWLDLDEITWRQCQVYEPQQWWLDKPDPGEGYRLLEKFPMEPKGPDDEEWDASERLWKWNPLIASLYDQHQTLWYRRRIEPVNSPEKLDSCVDCLEVGKEYTLPSGQSIFVTEKGFEVL